MHANHRGARCWLSTRPDLRDQYVRTTWSIHLSILPLLIYHVNHSHWRWHLPSVVESKLRCLISHHKPAYSWTWKFHYKKLRLEFIANCRKGRFSQNHLVISMFNNLGKTYQTQIHWFFAKVAVRSKKNLCTYTDCLETKDVRVRAPIFWGAHEQQKTLVSWTQKYSNKNSPYGCFFKWWYPKSSILIGFSIINHPFWDTTILGNPHIWITTRLHQPHPCCVFCARIIYIHTLGTRVILCSWLFITKQHQPDYPHHNISIPSQSFERAKAPSLARVTSKSLEGNGHPKYKVPKSMSLLVGRDLAKTGSWKNMTKTYFFQMVSFFMVMNPMGSNL